MESIFINVKEASEMLGGLGEAHVKELCRNKTEGFPVVQGKTQGYLIHKTLLADWAAEMVKEGKPI